MSFDPITLSADTLELEKRPGNGAVRIEFDGGSTCNIPRLGYGRGYGSFKIGNGPVYRSHFQRNMSANAAEICTLATAITVAKGHGARHLVVVGDSQIALKWANVCAGNREATKIDKTSESFKEAIQVLHEACDGIWTLETRWQPRINSVLTFGH